MSEFRYERPSTVHEAAALLARGSGGATNPVVLAGGTDVLVGLRAGTVQPDVVVDVKRIPELTGIAWMPDGGLGLGACLTLERLAADGRIGEVFPALTEGARAVGSVQIRTRATLGGNLVNASPCMDAAPPLLVLGAEVRLVSASGERDVPLAAFFRGVKSTAIEPDEILASVRLPAPARPGASAFAKLKRGLGHDLALVNAALALDGAGESTLARVAIGSCAPTPVMPPPVDLSGLGLDAAAERLVRAALEAICPIDDVRASAEYRRDMTAVLVRRLVARLWPEGRSER